MIAAHFIDKRILLANTSAAGKISITKKVVSESVTFFRNPYKRNSLSADAQQGQLYLANKEATTYSFINMLLMLESNTSTAIRPGLVPDS